MVSAAVTLVLGGAFLSSFLNVLFDRVASVQVLKPLINVLHRTKLRDDLLQRMEMLLLAVDKVLDDADEKQVVNPFVKKWLDKLKDAAYDAEDLLVAIGTDGQVQEQQLKDFNTRLAEIVSRLELIASEKDILSLKEGPGQGGIKSIPRLPSTSLVDESEICFRNEDKNHLLNILLSDDGVNRSGIPVIAIVGMGGIGKTTLAQFLYNDVSVKNYFNSRAWVYASEEFDVFKVTKTIYESVTLSHSDVKDLNVLQVTLQRTLMGRKFLLVLDNVWNLSLREWDLLRRPLQVGVAGSKIIITTRIQSVSSTIHDVLVDHDLKSLSKDDCWSLFTKHAFGDKDPDEDSTLKGIGKEIVKKCKGLPLAFKTLASLLRSESDAKQWGNVLKSSLWDLPDHKSDIIPALRLSYHYLPSQLKRCFAYCSIFPKGYKFEKGDLVRMWIAEGLVQQSNSGRRMEEVGEQCFHELLSRSLFQRSQDQSCFMMHDLVNDLAQHIAGEFCFKFERDNTPQNPARVRHLSCILKPSDTPDKFAAFYERSKALRTFLPLRLPGDGRTPFNPRVFKRLFPETSPLRVLSLSSYLITRFPDSVSHLKQLRYLDLSGAAIHCLPEKVGCLYNLETLKLSGCHLLTLLPANVSNLTKLEHLDMNETPILELPDSIGNLKQLSYLDLSGTKIQCLPEGVGCLYNLKTLKLSRCHRLSLLPASLGNLTNLEHLDLNRTPILELVDSVGDLKQLRYLNLSGTNIRCLPETICSLYNLQTLKLSRCDSLTLLPASLSNLTKLKNLDMKGTPIMELVDSIGDLIQLGYLDLSGTTIQRLPERICSLYNLQTLKLSCCTQLFYLPTCTENLTKLKQLDIKETPIQHMPPNFGNLKSLQQLTTFVVGNNSHLSTISEIKDLSLLHGTLSILRLQNVSQTAEAETANLKDKKYLRELIFEWDVDSRNGYSQNAACNPQNGGTENAGDDHHDNGNAQNAADDRHRCNGQNAVNGPLNGNGNLENGENTLHFSDAEIVEDNPRDSNTQNAPIAMDTPQRRNGQSAAEVDIQTRKAEEATNILDKLQPGKNLERLEIKNFYGTRLPRWLGYASFSKMESLTLESCKNCNSLPPLGQLPSLKALVILDLAGVKTVGGEFYGCGVVAFMSLETLMFKQMENWEEWLPFTNEQGFPSLRSLTVIGCSKLTGDVPIPPPLHFDIEGCGQFRFQGATN
ncbi:hypothetical protein PTKIN_Ptkin16aG0018000 [Pterospermum kingtungense]